MISLPALSSTDTFFILSMLATAAVTIAAGKSAGTSDFSWTSSDEIHIFFMPLID
jgi:hypothetical protein